MAEIWASLFILASVLVLGLHIFSMPANWVLLALTAAWKWAHPEVALSWGFFLVLAALAASGELLEFLGQILGTRRFGGTGRGNLGGILGAIVGAIVCAPFLLGLGAVPGALGGAFAGCLIMEMGQGRDFAAASRAAWGAFWGKFFGMVAKAGVGAAMVLLTAPRVWPG
ncbi:MAG: DUF456 domain-containing protein [Desulfovibrionaceae bacterium]|jgi:uncharacterized protein YqgC (DUF456 family)|nr:DUF456 domain-containing protein [Desulfovibrionaceae bacterium]